MATFRIKNGWVREQELNVMWAEDASPVSMPGECVISMRQQGDPETHDEIYIPRLLAPQVAAVLWPEAEKALREVQGVCDPKNAATADEIIASGVDLAAMIRFLMALLTRTAKDAEAALAQLDAPAEER